MKKWDEIDQIELSKWMTDFVNEKPKNSESFLDLHQRVTDFFNKTIIPNKNQSIIIVTHAGVIRSLICQLLEIPLQNAFKIQIDFGSITKIEIDNITGYQKLNYLNQK